MCPLGATNFIFECWKVSLTSERSDKIRIPARPCNILYVCNAEGVDVNQYRWSRSIPHVHFFVAFSEYVDSVAECRTNIKVTLMNLWLPAQNV